MKTPVMFLGLVVFAATTGFACEIPTVVQIPQAKEAKGHMKVLEAKTGDYVRSMVAYTECIKSELAAAGGDEAPPMLRSLLVQRNNQAVAEVKAVLDLYQERFGPLQDAQVSNAVRDAVDIQSTGAAPPIQSRAP